MRQGRNEPCSCGSGKKYKNCCLGKSDALPEVPESTIEAFEQVSKLLVARDEKALGALGERLNELLFTELAWVRIAPDAFYNALGELLADGGPPGPALGEAMEREYFRLVTPEAFAEVRMALNEALQNPALSRADRRVIVFAMLLGGDAQKPVPPEENMLVSCLFEAQLRETFIALNSDDAFAELLIEGIARAVSTPEAQAAVFRTVERMHDRVSPMPILTCDELVLASVADLPRLAQTTAQIIPEDNARERPRLLANFEILQKTLPGELGADAVEAIRNRANGRAIGAPDDPAAADLAIAARVAVNLLVVAAVLAPVLSAIWRSDEERRMAEAFINPDVEPVTDLPGFAAFLREKGEDAAAARVERAVKFMETLGAQGPKDAG